MKNNYFTALIHTLLPKQILTVLLGFFANARWPGFKHWIITQFIKQYRVNMAEAQEPDPAYYPCFNDFFIRKLKPQARTLRASTLVSPVDGVLSESGPIQKGQLLQAKGRSYTVADLLNEPQAQSSAFLNGKFATFYLSPKDYHRIHMPIDATVTHMTSLPGKLFSVQPATTQCIPNLFARNERLVVYLETALGQMVMVLVGATIVGKIATAWEGELPRPKYRRNFDYKNKPITLKQGEEMGYFKLGSTVILLLDEAFPCPADAAFLAQNKNVQLFDKLI